MQGQATIDAYVNAYTQGSQTWKTDLLRDALLGLESRSCTVNMHLMRDEDEANNGARALKIS